MEMSMFWSFLIFRLSTVDTRLHFVFWRASWELKVAWDSQFITERLVSRACSQKHPSIPITTTCQSRVNLCSRELYVYWYTVPATEPTQRRHAYPTYDTPSLDLSFTLFHPSISHLITSISHLHLPPHVLILHHITRLSLPTHPLAPSRSFPLLPAPSLLSLPPPIKHTSAYASDSYHK